MVVPFVHKCPSVSMATVHQQRTLTSHQYLPWHAVVRVAGLCGICLLSVSVISGLSDNLSAEGRVIAALCGVIGWNIFKPMMAGGGWICAKTALSVCKQLSGGHTSSWRQTSCLVQMSRVRLELHLVAARTCMYNILFKIATMCA